ncbi:SDR family NAD(P)-dependent oxidoreductase [Streptomyces sp. NPDC003077]|uniref:SDR family NAD(P)-dependent oxidoreductase n=1 Tax=Streptomyces sp. NPDC003077 TaxID=3154443 RepID=UPI0033A5DAE1
MTTTLITGAGRGLGLESARELVRAGHRVYLGARDPARGAAAARATGGRVLPLDVTSDASVRAAADRLREEAGHLDVLVNNAGIAGPGGPPDTVTAADLEEVYATNVFGPVRVLHAFLPLLRAGDGTPVVVNVSSGLGSLAVAAEPERLGSWVPDWIPVLPYASSKAALNMVTVQYAHAYPDLRINAVDPGFTATDLNGHTGTRTVAEGAEIIVRMARIGPDGPTGTFVSSAGAVPW